MIKLISILLAGLVVIGGIFYYRNLRGVAPAINPPASDISKILEQTPSSETKNDTSFPIKVPTGFSLSIFAKDLGGPRVLAFDKRGALLASIPGQNKVVAIVDGKTITVASGLKQPHGLAFSGEDKLYIAETDSVSIFDYNLQTKQATNKKKIIDLPGGGGHSTRSILFYQNKLYTSIGSSCNVCNESDNRRAKVFVSDADGSNFKEFAKGLRNSVFLTLNPKTKKIWATDMGRDHLGDDLPPDEINILEEGRDYGWPTCYGKNVHDANFDKSNSGCSGKVPSQVDLQAHSAPLGLAFIPDSWPEKYRNNLLVAFHGSWNRSTPTGYKIVHIKLKADGSYDGVEDFLAGWISGQNTLGRPVDIVFNSDGEAFISDDKAGVIYRLVYNR